jgi:ATP-dependent RNA helicase DeaD
VTSISHIINYDIPQSSDDYVHRVGRTGRMGREGIAYTFVTTEEGGELTRIEMLINRLLKRDDIEGFAAAAPLGGIAADALTPGAPRAGAPATATSDEAPTQPQPPRPAPPGRRPMKRHRRAL